MSYFRPITEQTSVLACDNFPSRGKNGMTCTRVCIHACQQAGNTFKIIQHIPLFITKTSLRKGRKHGINLSYDTTGNDLIT